MSARDADLHFAAQNERLRLAREQKIREEERALAQRRAEAVAPTDEPDEDPDFPGCVW